MAVVVIIGAVAVVVTVTDVGSFSAAYDVTGTAANDVMLNVRERNADKNFAFFIMIPPRKCQFGFSLCRYPSG